MDRWELEAAMHKFEAAMTIYERQEEWENYTAALNKLANTNIQADQFQKAYTMAQKSLEILKLNQIKGSLQEYKAYFIIGYYYDFAKFDFDQALHYYNRSLEFERVSGDSKHVFMAQLYNGIAILHSKNGKYVQAVPYYEKALEISKVANGEISSHVSDIYGNLGFNYQVYGDFEKSIYYQEKSIEIGIQINGEEHPDVAIAYSNLSETYENLFDLGKAVFYGEKALAIALSKFDEEHPFTAEVYQRLSSQYLKLDEPQKAYEFANRSLDILERKLGNEHPELIFPISSLASVSEYLGDNAQAIAHATRTLEICSKVYGDKHIRTANAYSTLADYISTDGDIEKSLAYQKRAIYILRKIYNTENHSYMVGTYEGMGDNYLKTNDYPNALKSYLTALDISQQMKPKNNLREAHLNSKIGTFYLSKDDRENAEKYIDISIDLLRQTSDSEFADDKFLSQQLLIELFRNKCKILKGYSEKVAGPGRLEEIKSLYAKADSIVDQVQYQISTSKRQN